MQLPLVYRTASVAAVLFNVNDEQITDANQAAADLVGYSLESLLSRHLSDLFHEVPDFRKIPITSAQLRQGKSKQSQVELQYVIESNEQHSIHILFLRPWNGSPEAAATSAKLQHSNGHPHTGTQLSKLVEASVSEMFLIRDEDLQLVYLNPAARRNLDYAPEEITALRLTDLFAYPDEIALNALLKPLRREERDRLQLHLKFLRKDGSRYDADVLFQVLEPGKSLMAIATDITAKLLTEERLRRTINEKETLIKEIHHRVKNNLQLISSIIYLKIISLGESDTRDFLEDTRQKIRSIALIHERLLQTEHLDQVEIADYLGKLVNDLRVTYIQTGLDLQIITDVEERIMNIDTAIICGLIVNELITNALKHAFRGRYAGQIRVDLHFDEQKNSHLLQIADDGVTLPSHIGPGESSSFGMQLVDVFVKQLNGSISIFREKGTKFQISF